MHGHINVKKAQNFIYILRYSMTSLHQFLKTHNCSTSQHRDILNQISSKLIKKYHKYG